MEELERIISVANNRFNLPADKQHDFKTEFCMLVASLEKHLKQLKTDRRIMHAEANPTI